MAVNTKYQPLEIKLSPYYSNRVENTTIKVVNTNIHSKKIKYNYTLMGFQNQTLGNSPPSKQWTLNINFYKST